MAQCNTGAAGDALRSLETVGDDFSELLCDQACRALFKCRTALTRRAFFDSMGFRRLAVELGVLCVSTQGSLFDTQRRSGFARCRDAHPRRFS